MRAFQKFSTQHEDFIHDLSYDFYGKRMATCSSDQKIKVWDLNDRSEWVCSAEWKAHNGSIWRVEWAHPEFGTIIASCSFDRTVCVWEEQEGSDGTTKWLCRATLLDSRQSVQDIKFAPRHLGLRLVPFSFMFSSFVYRYPSATCPSRNSFRTDNVIANLYATSQRFLYSHNDRRRALSME
jgi:nucleoporin SEH1